MLDAGGGENKGDSMCEGPELGGSRGQPRHWKSCSWAVKSEWEGSIKRDGGGSTHAGL